VPSRNMPPSDNTNTQGGKKGTGNSGGGSKNTKDDKAERKEKRKLEIEEIWKEVKNDVNELSKSLDEKSKKKSNKSLLSSSGKDKRAKQAQGKKADDPTEKVEDPTKEVLKIMEKVPPSPDNTNEKFRAAVTNTVQCINTLGNIVAVAVSPVSSIPLLEDHGNDTGHFAPPSAPMLSLP
jgi:hypothetical protein